MNIVWPLTLQIGYGEWTLRLNSTHSSIKEWAQYEHDGNILHAMLHPCGALDVWVNGDFKGFAATVADIPKLFA